MNEKENSKSRGLSAGGGIEHRALSLTQGRFAIVDVEDYDRLARHKWCAANNNGRFYAQRRQNSRTIKMHREILNIPSGLLCDHINHDTLDNNRRCNLRICTTAQNAYNRIPGTGAARPAIKASTGTESTANGKRKLHTEAG